MPLTTAARRFYKDLKRPEMGLLMDRWVGIGERRCSVYHARRRRLTDCA